MILAAWSITAIVGILTAHAVINTRLLRRPVRPPVPVDARVAVLLPLRDEAHRVGPCLTALLHQRHVARLEIVVLDDGSTDSTAAAVRRLSAGDPRVRLVAGAPLPRGWLGKAHACHQLAALASPECTLLAFVDADVVLAPDAIAAAVGLLGDRDLVSPYPRIVALSWGERLMQPLLQWSWLTFLPLRAVEQSHRPALAAAGGQFLVVRRATYDRAGGHAAVRGRVLEDMELARQFKRCGGRIALADGSRLATCRMYGSWRDLIAGYTKSLWAAFGHPAAAGMVVAVLAMLYVVPSLLVGLGLGLGQPEWVAAGLLGYGLGVIGRVLTGQATGARIWPDALAHPISIILFGWLVAASYRRHRTGAIAWKGRAVETGDG